jgi:hypothetical protein
VKVHIQKMPSQTLRALLPVVLLTVATTPTSSQQAGCDIKGNVSQDTGERIYHLPGQRYYNATKIEPDRGERWFCSEAEARTAGWRRSKV